MKIYKKLTLGFLSNSLLLALLAGLSLSINLGIKTNNNHIENNSLIEVENSKNMARSLQAIHTASQELLLEKYQEYLQAQPGSEQAELIRAYETIKKELSNFEIYLDNSKNANLESLTKDGNLNYGENLTEQEELLLIEDIEKEFFLYRKMIANYFSLVEKNQKEAYIFLEEEIEPKHRNTLMTLVKEYQDDALEELKYKSNSIRESITKDNVLIVVFASGSILISVGLGMLISHQISRPIKHLIKSASQVGQGKLNPIKIDSLNRENELFILSQAFNQMIEGLRNTTVSKSYLDDILSSMIDSLIVIDIEGNIQKVNQATLRLLGYQESELINKSIKLILPDQSLTIESSICNYFIGSCETTYLSKEGKKIPVAFSSSCILNDEKKAQGVVCVARNITEKQLAEKALRESEERYALASRAANDGLWDWNLTTNQIYFSPRWKSLLGYEDDEIDNSPEEWFTRVHPEYTDQLTREIITHLQNDISHFEISYPMEYNDGSYRWMLCRGIAVQDQEGKVYRLTGSQTDITLSRLVEEQLRYDALHDKLTGLPNRAFFLEELEELLETSKHEQDSMFTVLFLDLDRFKFINDSLGHLVGDELLIEFAHRIQTCLSSENTFARLGGDEFVIILKNIKNISDATQLAENIQKKLKKPFQLQGNEIFVSVSIGIAQSTSNYEQIEDILRDADTAMYQAKASGKARYALFEPGMHQKVLKTLALENDLRRALEQGEFELLYQPIVKLSNRQIMGFEALLRWQHPTKGFVSPEQFISLAEETGVIVPIGWWVMREAARQMRRWQERYPLHSSMTISVNVSAKQLDEINQVLNQIEKILEQTGLPPSCLKLEITESIIMNNTEQVAFMLKQLKALGIRLSMDDFGTGYSSLSYLHQLPIDTLKIDRSFVRNIDVDSEKFELAQTIVNLAKNLKMEAIAEGIETSKQLAKLEQLNCKYGQGYFFSKPMTSERAEALISSEQQVIQWWTRE